MKEEVNEVKESSSFSDFKLSEEVLDGLRDVGYETPTYIQEKCIPIILKGENLIASASTGTGKTAAFAIPILNQIFNNKKNAIQALIITPTRELAQQVDEQFWSMGYHTDIPSSTIYGGGDWGIQEKALDRKVNIITATPGRLMDFMRVKSLDFSQLDFLVLDEADRMLDMGFIPDIKKIIKSLPEERQNLMFSATIPPKIEQLANTMMSKPVRISASPMKPAEGIRQKVYNVDERDKLKLTLHLFEEMNWSSAIIFTSTKRNADVLANELKKKGASVTSIHGDRSQEEREAALKSFRNNEYKIIVATDVISRGIDIDNVSHVINYSVPHDTDDYIHRVGRTARAEATGDAITFVSGQDRRYMHDIYKALGDKIQKMELPEEVSNGQKSSDKKSGGNHQKTKDKPRRKDEPGSKEEPKSRKTETETKDKKKEKEESGSDSDHPNQNNRNRKRGKRGGRKRRGGKPPQAKQDGDSGDQNKKQSRDDQKSGGRGRGKKGKPSGSDKSSDRRKASAKRSDRTKPEDGDKQQKRHKGKSGPHPKGRKRGPGKKQQRKGQQESRSEAIDNVKSPDMDKIQKGQKKGVWGKIKSIFGS